MIPDTKSVLVTYDTIYAYVLNDNRYRSRYASIQGDPGWLCVDLRSFSGGCREFQIEIHAEIQGYLGWYSVIRGDPGLKEEPYLDTGRDPGVSSVVVQ